MEKINEVKEKVMSKYENCLEKITLLETEYRFNINRLSAIESHIAKLNINNDFEILSLSPRKLNSKINDDILSLNKEKESIEVLNKELEKNIKELTQKKELFKLIAEYIEEDEIEKDSYEEMYHSAELTQKKIFEMQELERKRISRDLHDSSVQNLVHLLHKTELCGKYMDSDIVRAKLELQLIYNNIKLIIDDIRNVIFDLRPMVFDDLELEEAVLRLVNNMQTHTDNAIIHYEFIGNKKVISDIYKNNILRIIQESVNNSIKHAKASHIDIKIDYNKNIEVTIKDNGVGFLNEEVKDTKGYGLSIMKERVKSLLGDILITSDKNSGTLIKVNIPIQ